MNTFNKRTAWRIAAVSLLLASLASPVAWFVARENAEDCIVSLAIEESGRLSRHHDALNLNNAGGADHAAVAAKTIVGGFFDIVEIYDSKGRKLAESLTDEGHAVESSLDKHGSPNLEKDTGSHFDPAVMAVFSPMARATFDRLANGSEADARQLLEDRVRHHFEI